MNCREFEQRLNDAQLDLTDAMSAHLQTCRSCRRAWQSAVKIRELIQDSSGPDRVPTLAQVKRRVESNAARQSTWRQVMSNMSYEFISRPRLAGGLLGAMVVFLFLTLVPFSYSVTAGYEVTVENGHELTLEPKAVEAAVAFLAPGEITTTTDADGHQVFHVRQREFAVGIRQYLSVLTDGSVKLTVTPIIEYTSGSLLAQVVESVARKTEQPGVVLRFDNEHLAIEGEYIQSMAASPWVTDAEVEARLKQLLSPPDSSKTNVRVEVTTDVDEDYRVIRLYFEGAARVKVNGPVAEVFDTESDLAEPSSGGLGAAEDSGQAFLEIAGEEGRKIDLTGKPIVLKIQMQDH